MSGISEHTVYDELPYDCVPIPGTSPPRLALCSYLHGGPQTPVEQFRLLEIGCNNANNLLPLAFYHPNAQFVGIDNAATAISAGHNAAKELELENVVLQTVDLRTAETLTGEFHYILVHGVFSWVNEAARKRILALCAQHLAPDGVVYLSHNVDAGWRIRGLVREVLMDATEALPTAQARNQRARDLASSLSAMLTESELPYHQMLMAEFQRALQSTESYLAHETLSPTNVAFRHDTVVNLLATHGFTYLADALYDHPEGRAPEALALALGPLGGTGAALEQLTDVMGCRQFRSSVFCRVEARATDASTSELAAGIHDLFVAGTANEDAEHEPPIDEEFDLPRDAQLATALLLLAKRWPDGMRVGELLKASAALIDAAPLGDAAMRERLLAMHRRGRVELSLVAPPACAASPTAVPHRLARYQAAHGADLTMRSHWPMVVDANERMIVGLLGEGKPIDEIVNDVVEQARRGEVQLAEIIENPDSGVEAQLHDVVSACRDTLDRWGLLE